ncbi:MAG: tRNA cyclic N6-threonylcarbamoyladenosine(37) synthase TcdA [Spirochaetes bacterium GWF1_31_7]|nr:MAG: tRNA cyclic N6-threonylcarbamoyladenosine(37) synthase TcdA [Spirochaetes bacterium GWE1_32_154]OHD49045.1 MAG: tRNA cyclic N6-threonylcarbamoyladenosine(37) synthase TcdA [Spirochaetes bacterium GWF1_31_7]OHD50371.1 MAG: tRNA cyclic N6-threonylcarbamoyladenosine(37) synthase TcdA [Spirochaetes bacterium GWE2_31_10]OHD75733.1 MAG: tRNA cyclic N6-threonylcarbamoyladenosine(37) synthase TcdA [Spirochaetes bacterium RIFOXYB1_FULL_32_8]HBD93840.1 tRNA cyclic N6-threonylcarbamoyladenosine(37
MLHQFSRTEMIIGTDGLHTLRNSKIAVFGVGGVGSYAVEALARAGIGSFILVDDDLVCLTNLNRQIIATRKTIGKPKVEVMRDRILEINPDANVVIHQQFYLPGNNESLVTDDTDYIIDAIDTVTAKIGLVMESIARKIPIISSMGTGNKFHPERLEITDIYKTTVCPLARVMRQELKKRGVKRLKVIYSKEEPVKTVLTESNDCAVSCVCPVGTTRKCTTRHKVPGSISFVPPAAGMIIASVVIRELLGIR